jgi:hypothetical protein
MFLDVFIVILLPEGDTPPEWIWMAGGEKPDDLAADPEPSSPGDW